jgi:hypothetical protein
MSITGAAATAETAPPPPLDVAWHLELLQRIGKTNRAQREHAEQSLTNFLQSMRSPLQIVNPAPCQEQHELLIQCLEKQREKVAAAKENGNGAAEQLWRQNLALASSGSAKHIEAVAKMTESLPDAMPKSSTGALLGTSSASSSPCMQKLFELTRCSSDAVAKFYSTLETVQRRAAEFEKPALPK